MNVGDLVEINRHGNGNELCLVVKIDRQPNSKDEIVSLYFFSGAQRRCVTLRHHVELVNEAG